MTNSILITACLALAAPDSDGVTPFAPDFSASSTVGIDVDWETGDEDGDAADGCRAKYPLRRRNKRLGAALQAGLRRLGYSRWIKNGRLSVSVVDLSEPNRAHYAGVNDDKMLYSASLPKIVTLLAVMGAVEEGKLSFNDELERRLTSMINRSSNRDASWAFDLVGPEYTEYTVRRAGMCFYGNQYGGLWLGRRYGKGGRSKRDPLFRMSHGATSRQVARYYTLLDRGMMINERVSNRMLEMMRPPAIRHKFVRGIQHRDGVKFLGRKSGSWRTYHSDSALIVHGKQRYVLAALSNHPRGGKAMVEIAKLVDDLVTRGLHRPPDLSRPDGRRAELPAGPTR